MDPGRIAEAERLLGIADKLLQTKDFTGSRDFAILAQETEPLLEGSDQILAVADVLLAADKRISHRNLDWYGILQVDRRSDDMELIRKQYRRLALLLHPDKNQFMWADSAFRLVAEAWGVLSNPAKKSAFDNELGFYTRVDLIPVNNPQRPFGFQQFRRHEDNPSPAERMAPPPAAAAAASSSAGGGGGGGGGGVETRPPGGGGGRVENRPPGGGGGRVENRANNFWTACPYCYNLYEYPKIYIDCCLRCQNCERAFHAAKIESLPPAVPGKDAYYCYWGFFPVGFSAGEVKELPTPLPPVPNPASQMQFPMANGGGSFVPVLRSVPVTSANANASHVTASSNANASATPVAKPGAKKRGRPRKNVLA